MIRAKSTSRFSCRDSRNRPCSLERWATEFRGCVMDRFRDYAFRTYYRRDSDVDPLVRFVRAINESSQPIRVPFGHLHIWYMYHRLVTGGSHRKERK